VSNIKAIKLNQNAGEGACNAETVITISVLTFRMIVSVRVVSCVIEFLRLCWRSRFYWVWITRQWHLQYSLRSREELFVALEKVHFDAFNLK